jgi:glycerol kinase
MKLVSWQQARPILKGIKPLVHIVNEYKPTHTMCGKKLPLEGVMTNQEGKATCQACQQRVGDMNRTFGRKKYVGPSQVSSRNLP